jgi:hypothetical protein
MCNGIRKAYHRKKPCEENHILINKIMVKMEQSNAILFTSLVLDVQQHISGVGRMTDFFK